MVRLPPCLPDHMVSIRQHAIMTILIWGSKTLMWRLQYWDVTPCSLAYIFQWDLFLFLQGIRGEESNMAPFTGQRWTVQAQYRTHRNTGWMACYSETSVRIYLAARRHIRWHWPWSPLWGSPNSVHTIAAVCVFFSVWSPAQDDVTVCDMTSPSGSSPYCPITLTDNGSGDPVPTAVPKGRHMLSSYAKCNIKARSLTIFAVEKH